MDIRQTVLDTIPKELWIDLEDRHRAEAFNAHNGIKASFALNSKRSRELEGQARFRLQEQGFEEVVQLHGGHIVENGIMPGTDLRVYQPFARFQGADTGVILGFAAMPETRKLPPKNMSRVAGVSLNVHLQLDLLDDPTKLHAKDLFVLFLTARDRTRPGMIEEIAVGVIGSDYKDFVFYESLEDFLRGYGEIPATPEGPDGPVDEGAAIKLRPTRKPFLPPELLPDSDAEDGTNG
jgi:hypothetical protein